MATYAIGDVQGCLAQLKNLLAKINFDKNKDKLWFCGDIVNRGPESLSTLRFIYELKDKAIVVLGNHDLYCLSRYYGSVKAKKSDSLADIFSAEDKDELLSWLIKQPILHVDTVRKATLVHAGIPPCWDLKTARQLAKEIENLLQDKNKRKDLFANMYGNSPHLWQENLIGWERIRFAINAFTRMRYCYDNGALQLTKKSPPELDEDNNLFPWFKMRDEKKDNFKCYFGHWAALRGISNSENYIALDTGCVWGGTLTAINIDSGQRYEVPGWKELT